MTKVHEILDSNNNTYLDIIIRHDGAVQDNYVGIELSHPRMVLREIDR